MRYGIPLLNERVAPRCANADSLLLVTVKGRRIQDRSVVSLGGTTWPDVAEILMDEGVDALVCGGVGHTTRESIRTRRMEVIENVAGTRGEVLEALRRGRLRPGFGLGRPEVAVPDVEVKAPEGGLAGRIEAERKGPAGAGPADCLACEDRVCLTGRPCPYYVLPPVEGLDKETGRIVESAVDVACEEERTLCRLAELVYFALEMEYERIGVAFCVDLLEPASILADVLERFFDVTSVCCRVGGRRAEGGMQGPGSVTGEAGPDLRATVCDPVDQAAVLNAAQTDLNVAVGLCVGADAAFSSQSDAPVTTIFVKDKSLANNPIGAVYSHYYLTDI